MNKKTIFAATIIMSLFAFADDAVKSFPVPPSKMAEYVEKSGGLVPPPADMCKLYVLDARKEDVSQLTNHLHFAETRLFLSVVLKHIDSDGTTDFWKVARESKSNGAGAVIVIYERKGAPVLTAYPEEAVTLLNVEPLKEGVEYTPYRKRLAKELWRSIGFALGAYGSPTPMVASSMQPVFSLEDLDALNGWMFTPQQMVSVFTEKSKLKLYNPDPVPYSRACREGWAPKPTNDVQRAIYNRHKSPLSKFDVDLGK